MLTLCGLYVAQGIPWGFVTVTFAAWLAQPKNGITTEQLGPILAVASLPWSFKFLWGPLMDRFTLPSLGRRRPWIIFAQSMAILVLGSMILLPDLPGMVWTTAPEHGRLLRTAYQLVPGPLAALILLANIFVSMQDVAVDALAVDLLKEEERGVANGLMYGSSYFGTAIGGAGLGYIVATFGIQAGLLGQALLLSLIMLLPVFFRERPAMPSGQAGAGVLRGRPGSASHSAIDFGENPVLPASLVASPYSPPGGDTIGAGPNGSEPTGMGTTDSTTDSSTDATLKNDAASDTDSVLANLYRAFSLRATLLGAVVAVTVKVGIGVLTAVLVDYLMKDGGWTQQEYTSVTGGWAVMLGLCGSALGGYVADLVGPKPVIFTLSVLLGLLWVCFGLAPDSLTSRPLMTSLLLGQEFLLAVLSVSLFSLFMGISWPRVAATQFTTYMALMNLSTTIGSYTAGRLSQWLSIDQILVVAGILQAVLVIPVLFIDPHQTRRILDNGSTSGRSAAKSA
ncbi:MAG: MFS transporter [Fuerstiella sp.]